MSPPSDIESGGGEAQFAHRAQEIVGGAIVGARSDIGDQTRLGLAADEPMRDDDALTAEEFARRFRLCAPTLWCVAAAIVGDRVRAEDILQEAAMIALGKLDDFEAGTSMRAWLAQIVRYVALNHRRRAQRRGEHLGTPRLSLVEDPEPVGVSPRGELVPGQRNFDDTVVAALDDLGDTARACLLLRTVMDLGYGQIGEVLGIPEGTAMSHVHRARTRMRKTLGDEPASVVSGKEAAR